MYQRRYSPSTRRITPGEIRANFRKRSQVGNDAIPSWRKNSATPRNMKSKRYQVDAIITKHRNRQRATAESDWVASMNVSNATALCSISSLACQHHNRLISEGAVSRWRGL